MRIDKDGNVGIGNATPEVALDVNGYVRLGTPFTPPGTEVNVEYNDPDKGFYSDASCVDGVIRMGKRGTQACICVVQLRKMVKDGMIMNPIKKARVLNEWTQDYLSEKTGVHRSRISNYERGLKPTKKDGLALAEALKLTFNVDTGEFNEI